MKFLLLLASLTALSSTAALATDGGEDKTLPGLRLVSTKRIPINNKENQRSLKTEGEYIWEEMHATAKKRRRKRFKPGAFGDDSSNSSSSDSSSSKGSEGSKGSKGDSSSSDNGRVDKCYGDDCNDGEEECFECAPACELVVYEFAGQTGRLIGDESADPVFNSIFNQYVQDDNVYQPDGQLNTIIQDPAVYNTAKCLQVRLGKQCEGQEGSPIEDRVCCEGLTMCEFQYSLSDNLGFIGDIVASGGLVDNAVNVIPITGGVGEFEKAYGEVVISAEYFDPAINSCPNISEVDFYNIAAKIYVEECEYSSTFFAQEEQVEAKSYLKKNRKKGGGWQ